MIDLGFCQIDEIKPEDCEAIVNFHRVTRTVTDLSLAPDLAEANIADGFYDRIWAEHFKTKDKQETKGRALKVNLEGCIIGIVRYGLIPNLPYEPLVKHGAHGWGELHQLYIDPAYQNHGLGRTLFIQATQDLASWGAARMLVRCFRDNSLTRRFYEHLSAQFLCDELSVVKRNGKNFEIPTSHYVLPNLSDYVRQTS